MIGSKSKYIITTAIAAATLGLGMAVAKADEASDVAAIEDLWNTYEAAVIADDAEAWLALWDAEGIQMPPGRPARPYAELKEMAPGEWAAGDNTGMNIYPKDIVIADDWAFSRGEYDISFMQDGSEVTLDGKFLTILKRQPDGSFKIYRDCFNMNGE
jgi:ketosteroid isomerase-like protein